MLYLPDEILVVDHRRERAERRCYEFAYGMADTAGLGDKDRAMLKRWRTSKMRLGSDDMNDFVNKANEDFAANLARRERSQIRKPDWIE